MAQKKDTKKTSSGAHKIAKLRLQARKTRQKIARWTRYKEEIQAGTRKGESSRWDTTGLQKHLDMLEALL